MRRHLILATIAGLALACNGGDASKEDVLAGVDAIWNGGDLATIDARYTEGIADELKEKVESSRKFYPDLSLTIDPIAVDGNTFFYRWLMTGTHAKYGKRVELRGVTYGRLENGKVVEEQIFYDRLEEADQLGFMIRSPAEL